MPPTEVFPSIWTAHFHTIDSKVAMDEKIRRGPDGKAKDGPLLVVNTAPCQCKAAGDFYGEGVTILSIDLEDDPDEKKQFDQGKPTTSKCAQKDVELKKRCAGDALKDFERVSQAMEECINAQGECVVHCHASISRSAAFIVAHIMRTQRRTALDVIKEMKGKWDATWPCDLFVMQLIQYEKDLLGKPTTAAWLKPLVAGVGVGALLAMLWSRGAK